MRILNGVGRLDEERDAFRQRSRGAGRVNWLTLHIVHDQPGKPIFGNAAVNQPGDIRMVEPGQKAPLVVKRRCCTDKRMALDQLDRDLLIIQAVAPLPSPNPLPSI